MSSCKETSGFLTHHTYVDCQYITVKKGTDKTVQLVVPSVSSNNYLLILFDIDINSMFAKTIPNCNKHYIKYAYANILEIHKNRGLKHQLHTLDNEASDILKEFITEKKLVIK